jgi:hypothetical protein
MRNLPFRRREELHKLASHSDEKYTLQEAGRPGGLLHRLASNNIICLEA